MENTTNAAKTDNFLKAIHKYTAEQSNTMHTEVEQLKEKKLKKAEENGKRDSQRYIKEQLELKKNAETSKLAKLIQDSQKQLFIERAKMTDKVFEMAEKKLISYAETDEYKNKLIDSASEIAEVFGGNDCVVYLNEKDMDSAYKISKMFSGNVKVEAAKTIKIGGVKGFCEALNIVADETLDSKLAAQREWFIENSGLSVLD